MVRSIKGLDPSIAKKVELQPCWTFEDMCKLAIKVKKYSNHKGPFSGTY